MQKSSRLSAKIRLRNAAKMADRRGNPKEAKEYREQLQSLRENGGR